MTKEQTFTVKVVSRASVDVGGHVWDALTELERLDGVESVMVSKKTEMERDMSEIEDTLASLDTEALERLRDTIDYYTEDDNE